MSLSRLADWDVEIHFKNFAKYNVPWESIRYKWAASKPGDFTIVVPLNSDTVDILRGSEITIYYLGEPVYAGKITNKTPNYDSGIITLEGLDWLGLLNERQISFQTYDESGYDWAGGSADDSWDYGGLSTGVPGILNEMEGADIIIRMLRHFTGEDITDTEFGDPDDMPYVERSITWKKWRFEGETLTQSFQKNAKVMQASNLRFGYNFWVDGSKNWWLRRYGDQIYNKRLHAIWSPPIEDVSSVINHLHFVGGIATPFPPDREAICDYDWSSNVVRGDNHTSEATRHGEPTQYSKGWGCWIKRDDYEPSGYGFIQVKDNDTYYVTGPNKKSIQISLGHSYLSGGPRCYSAGVYFEIDNEFSEFRDSLNPDGELRNWSNRAQLNSASNASKSRMSHRIMTLTFYLLCENMPNDAVGPPITWGTELFKGVKLKVYTKTPTMPPTNNPATHLYETCDNVYDLDITAIFRNYFEKWRNWQNDHADRKWMRVNIVFHDSVESDIFEDLRLRDCGGGGGGGGGGDIRYRIVEPLTEQGGNVDVKARWNEFSDKPFPDPEDIWGFGLELSTELEYNSTWDIYLDHMFFGFGEINVERWDDISIQANRHSEKWIQDRKCHSWARGAHLAEVLLDSMKYAQRSRSASLSYFNHELRPNLLIPVEEYGVEWMYVLNEMEVKVTPEGTKSNIQVGSPRPTPDDLLRFYEMQQLNIQTGGVGKGVYDWVANAKCQTNCERFCEFACLSDWSTTLRKGGHICQTARQTTCQRCESAEELNPCLISCLKYSQIAAIAMRPPADRTDVDNTILLGDGYLTGHGKDAPPITEKEPYTGPPAPVKCAKGRIERW